MLLRMRGRVDERLQRLTQTGPQPEQAAEAPETRRRELFPTVGKLLETKGRAERLQLALTRAGLPLRPEEFAGATLFLGGVLALIGCLSTGLGTLGAALGLGAGLIGPQFALSFLQTRRRGALNNQ